MSNTALFAKQAATIDSLSGGRLTLGLAPGTTSRPGAARRRAAEYELLTATSIAREATRRSTILEGSVLIGFKPTPAQNQAPLRAPSAA